MNDYLVRFADGNYVFFVLLERQEDLENIADSLVNVFAADAAITAGRAAANFMYWGATDGRARLLGLEEAQAHLPTHQSVFVDVQGRNPKVYVFSTSPRRAIYAGNVKGFRKWLSSDSLLGKTIVFRYTSGSSVGNRVVKVEKVEHKRGTVYYCGKDLKKGEYRCYDHRHIEGEILVMDEDGSVSAA